MDDMNLTILAGRMAATPEVTTFASGARLWRGLVTVRTSEPRRRIDVIPVVLWDPKEDSDALSLERGDRVWIAGSVQRRFWSADAGRTSRVEIVCHEVVRKVETAPAMAGVLEEDE